jgi:hypothetical protein
LEYIGKLYSVEKSAREQNLKADQIVVLRREHSAPVLAEFKTWLESLLKDCRWRQQNLVTKISYRKTSNLSRSNLLRAV